MSAVAKLRRPAAVWVTFGAAVVIAGGYSVRSAVFTPDIGFTDIVQLTNDGGVKEGLVTDGRTVFFGESRGEKIVLRSVSANGGPVHEIAFPLPQVLPVDVTRDGRLLVLGREGEEPERELWVVSGSGIGFPRRAGEIRCHSAAWSPDGRWIVYAYGSAIYIADTSGSSPIRLQSFASRPASLHWSSDGARIRFTLEDWPTSSSSFGEIALNRKNPWAHPVLKSFNTTLRNVSAGITAQDAQGRSFADADNAGNREILLLLRGSDAIRDSGLTLKPLRASIHNVSSLALDPHSKRLFAIGDSAVLEDGVETERSDLISYYPDVHAFKPFLPGISATDVDVSHDGKWIAFIRKPHRSLWTGHQDGTGLSQMEFPSNEIELPRWSPDGRRIAFMARMPGRPWRIYIVPSEGGDAKEASTGTDSQGAPTWSPDGKFIVYGNVMCQEMGICAIHMIDVAARTESIIPGTEGLGTARWSPDGRLIAALRPETHEAVVLGAKSGELQKVADGINGNDLSWSPDSRFIYASRPAGRLPEIVQIELKSGNIRTAADLTPFAKLTGRIDTWFTIAPDGAIIFSHEESEKEVFVLQYH